MAINLRSVTGNYVKIVQNMLYTNGGHSGAAVTRLHAYHQDVGLNPAAARNEKTDIGQTPAQKVPQQSGRISVEDRRCKAEHYTRSLF